MRKPAVGLALFGIVMVVTMCSQSTDVEVDDTEVAVRNELVGIVLPTGMIVDSVHAYGLRVGDVSFGVVHAPETTEYREATVHGPSTPVEIDSLGVFVELQAGGLSGTVRYVVRDVPSFTVDVRRYERNMLILDTNALPIAEMFGVTRVKVVNGLRQVRMGTDSVKSLDMHGVSINGATLGDIFGGDSTEAIRVADTAHQSMSFDSIVVTKVSCFSQQCAEQVFVFRKVSPLPIAVDRYVTRRLEFVPGSKETSDLYDALDE